MTAEREGENRIVAHVTQRVISLIAFGILAQFLVILTGAWWTATWVTRQEAAMADIRKHTVTDTQFSSWAWQTERANAGWKAATIHNSTEDSSN